MPRAKPRGQMGVTMQRFALAAGALVLCGASLLALHPVLNAPVAEGVAASVRPVADAPATLPETNAAGRLKALAAQRKALREPTLDEVADGVLVELGLKDAPAAPSPDELRDVTAEALRGIGALTGRQVDVTAATPGPSLHGLVAEALRQGQSDAGIDALVNAAVTAGEIKVPSALVTPDGRVDTHVLLAGLIARAQSELGRKADAPTIAGGDGVEVRMVQKADGVVEQYQFYTVQPGDSLGAIAVRFYGDMNRYMAVFEANRMILSSPDRIKVGQRLVIPTA